MKRYNILSVILPLLLIMLPLRGFGLGLGEIRLRSTLNHPLKAEIQLFDLDNLSLKDIQATLAPLEIYDEVGVERSSYLNHLNFRVLPKPKSAIQITTDIPIRVPVLQFLVDVAWPHGQLVRQYTLLLNPSIPAEETASPSNDSTKMDTKTQLDEPSNTASTENITIDFGKKTATLIQQASKANSPTVWVPQPFKLAEAQTTLPPTAQTPLKAAALKTYGPTKHTDTLWKIAHEVTPNPKLNPDQLLVAIFRYNRKAFAHNNINGLKAGYHLTIPTVDQITSIDTKQALDIVNDHDQAWLHRSLGNPSHPSMQPSAVNNVSARHPLETDVAFISEREKAFKLLEEELAISVETTHTTKKNNELLTQKLAEFEKKNQLLSSLVHEQQQQLTQLFDQKSKRAESMSIHLSQHLNQNIFALMMCFTSIVLAILCLWQWISFRMWQRQLKQARNSDTPDPMADATSESPENSEKPKHPYANTNLPEDQSFTASSLEFVKPFTRRKTGLNLKKLSTIKSSNASKHLDQNDSEQHAVTIENLDTLSDDELTKQIERIEGLDTETATRLIQELRAVEEEEPDAPRLTEASLSDPNVIRMTPHVSAGARSPSDEDNPHVIKMDLDAPSMIAPTSLTAEQISEQFDFIQLAIDTKDIESAKKRLLKIILYGDQDSKEKAQAQLNELSTPSE